MKKIFKYYLKDLKFILTYLFTVFIGIYPLFLVPYIGWLFVIPIIMFISIPLVSLIIKIYYK